MGNGRIVQPLCLAIRLGGLGGRCRSCGLFCRGGLWRAGVGDVLCSPILHGACHLAERDAGSIAGGDAGIVDRGHDGGICLLGGIQCQAVNLPFGNGKMAAVGHLGRKGGEKGGIHLKVAPPCGIELCCTVQLVDVGLCRAGDGHVQRFHTVHLKGCIIQIAFQRGECATDGDVGLWAVMQCQRRVAGEVQGQPSAFWAVVQGEADMAFRPVPGCLDIRGEAGSLFDHHAVFQGGISPDMDLRTGHAEVQLVRMEGSAHIGCQSAAGHQGSTQHGTKAHAAPEQQGKTGLDVTHVHSGTPGYKRWQDCTACGNGQGAGPVSLPPFMIPLLMATIIGSLTA
ncbi:hypothetical protein DTI93_05025 [Parasaccharibacter sp. TMW 2.1884]|nr:hypothetical protein [Parasaccharibacter sp. TMW 2.1884]